MLHLQNSHAWYLKYTQEFVPFSLQTLLSHIPTNWSGEEISLGSLKIKGLWMISRVQEYPSNSPSGKGSTQNMDHCHSDVQFGEPMWVV